MKLLSEILEILCLCIHHIHSKEINENATRKQSLLENINVPCKVCLLRTKFYAYALKVPSEVKMLSY